MVNPILPIAVALATAFLLPIIRKAGAAAVPGVVLLALGFATVVPASHLPSLLAGGPVVEVGTAGVHSPISINLRLGASEAVVLALLNLVAMGSLIRLSSALRSKLSEGHVAGHALFLLMIMGANGIIMTRDLFNVFVFLEIMSIATYGLLVVGRRRVGLQAAFKYIVAGGIGSALFLIGVILVYRQTGSLSIDEIVRGAPEATPILFVGSFLLAAAVLIELKPFPANGWALDVYQAAHPGIAASVSAATASAVVVVLYKLLPVFRDPVVAAIAWVGLLTFFSSNLIGLVQKDEKRMLGYSSVAQIGLVSFVVATAALSGWQSSHVRLVAGGLLINHLIAKAGLFWTTDSMRRRASGTGGDGRPGFGRRASVLAVAGLSLALIGLPPFPGFWAKWALVHRLAEESSMVPLALILLGSLFEAVYMLRWLGRRVWHQRDVPASEARPASDPTEVDRLPVVLPALALIILTGAGVYTGFAVGFSSPLLWFPVALLLFLGLIDSAPVRVTGPPAIAALALGGYYVYPLVSGLRMLFAVLFVTAGIVVLLGVLHRKKRAPGLVPLVASTTASLVVIVTAGSGLEMFFAWEILTVATYLLVLRRPRGRGAALTYGAFSIGAALAILAGFALLAAGTPSGVSGLAGISLEIRSASPGTSVPTGIGTAGLLLVAVGVLVKAAAAGLHLWLPEAYGATDDEATALLSSAVSKAAVYALFLTAGLMLFGTAASAGSGLSAVSPNSPATAGLVAAVLGWIGIATALFGALLAVFQEDAKQLLAYSSMSQLGYMIVGVSLLSHLGWVSGLYLTVLHAVVKAMLFLAIAGVIARAGTSSMYRLGGLIKRMPATFVSVLMAIIAVSGVPPLAGFGGKWLLYTAMIEQGWYLQAGLAFFASAVAFLYLFRLIHTIFLGQLKDEHRSTREAPPALLIPQFLLIALLMAMSMFPNLILEPAIAAAQPYFARTIAEEGYTVISSLGYWNGNLVMYVTMGVFALPFIWLVIIMRRPQHVEQFNIVYAAERPERPETTHFAHNFFAPYRKALGFLVTPLLRRLYRALAGGTEAIASALRRIYTGNGQTYALHIVLFLVVIFFAVGGAP